MKIAIVGTQNSGKSLLIKKIIERWRMYEKPSPTYRDFIKTGTPLNQQGTLESQKQIRDALVEQALSNKDKEFCVHDRCILDNLIYTLWLSDKGKISDTNFIAESFNMTRETLKCYDIIFFLPLSENSPVTLEKRDNRDLDLIYRKEIDSLFNAAYESYMAHDGLIFPTEDSPAFIILEGDEEVSEKTKQIAYYIDENGNVPSEEDTNLMQDLEDEFFKLLEERAKKKKKSK